MGNFCILVVFERYLSNAWTDPPMSADVPLPPQRFIGPWGWEEGELKTQKMGDDLIRAADSYHFYFSQRCQMWFNM